MKDTWDALARHSFGFALTHAVSQAYNEKAFQYFLEIERKRSELANRPFVLILIDFGAHRGFNREIGASAAAKLFSLLSRCLRETDFTGWYREGSIVGAVLTQDGVSEDDESLQSVRRRIEAEIAAHLPGRLRQDVRMRVCRVDGWRMSS